MIIGVTTILFLILTELSGFIVADWWTLGTQQPVSQDPKHTKMLCAISTQLNERQRKICQKYPRLMTSVAHGARLGVEECQHRFKGNRWNCSVPKDGTLFGPVFKKACRESAFLHAIAAAGVSHAVTTSCSAGTIESCGCGESTAVQQNKKWELQGCSSNVKYGNWFSREFVDVKDRKNPARRAMNKHNYEAGRQAISSQVFRKCKCHGLSGSCSTKTCWMQQPSFRQVGKLLKEKFDSAVRMKVIVNKKGKQRLRPKNKDFKKPTEVDLIYYESSPKFCERDVSNGSYGTRGRTCNISSAGIDGCNLLCCGRGYNVQQVVRTKNCNCVFVWCCHVKCDKCKTIQNLYTCK